MFVADPHHGRVGAGRLDQSIDDFPDRFLNRSNGADGSKSGVETIELSQRSVKRPVRGFQFFPGTMGLFVQPGVMNGDGGLAGKNHQQFDLLIGE